MSLVNYLLDFINQTLTFTSNFNILNSPFKSHNQTSKSSYGKFLKNRNYKKDETFTSQIINIPCY